VTTQQITWVVTGYILSSVLVMPITALLSSRFGRKNFYMFSVALFTAASMLSGLARTLPVMVAFRILQGVGGGALITVSQAILRESFPPREQGLAMGIYGMGIVLAPAIGPTLGGYLADHYSWPLIFYINVPVGMVNLFLVSHFIHDPPYLIREKGMIDWLGLALMMVGLGALQLMLEEGQQDYWFQSSFIIATAVVAAIGLTLFVWRELVAPRPAVQLRILKNLSFTSATVLGGVLGMGLLGTLFLLPLFLQTVIGYSAMEAGEILTPRSVAMLLLMPITGRLYNRLGPRILVGTGLAVSAYSFWRLGHLTSTVGFWNLFWPQVWQGVGFSLIFVALSTAALAEIDRTQMTQATGLYNVVRQVAGSVGIAVAATIATNSTTRYYTVLGEHLTIYDPATRLFLEEAAAALRLGGSDSVTAGRQALAVLNLNLLEQATVLAYNHAFKLVALLFALSVPLAFFLRRPAGAAAAGALEGG
jgi:DHA2 family multidrug resistance protein